jgi:hypothetical protein
MIARKAALYSTRTTFLAGQISRTLVGGEPDSNGVDPQILSWTEDFGEHLAVLLPYLQDGCIGLHPTSSTLHDAGRVSTGDFVSLLRVQLRRDYLLEQVAESPSGVSIMLPHLAGVRPSDLLKVRQDHQEQFSEFQRALSRLLHGGAEDADRLLYELMQEVDQQVRSIDRQMRKLSRARWFASAQAAIVPFSLVLALMPPFPLAEAIRAAVAALSTSDLIASIKSLQQVRDASRDLEASPFYVPWVLTKMAS